MNTPTAPLTSTTVLAALASAVRDLYNPEDCEACETEGATCWECAECATLEHAANTIDWVRIKPVI